MLFFMYWYLTRRYLYVNGELRKAYVHSAHRRKVMKLENNQNNTTNELNKKQVFIDLNTKSFEAEVSDNKTTYAALEQGDLHRKTVFDEAYAAMKTVKNNVAAPIRSVSTARTSRKRTSSGGNRFKPNKFWNKRLCSGELPADALRRITRELFVLVLFCFAVCFLFSVKGFILNRITDTDYSALARGTSYSAPVGDMEFDFSKSDLPDGFAAAQAVCTQLNMPNIDFSDFENNRHAPLYPGKVLSSMKSVITESDVTLKTNMSNLDLLVQIYQSLEHNTPVIVLLSEKEGDTYSMQYAVVSHIDAEQNKITVCNPNSGTTDYTLEQFIAATRFSNHKEKSVRERVALAVGSWARNTAIFVKASNE